MASELRGFVFAVVFIIVFGTLLVSVPVGLQGPGEEPDTIIPVDPSIMTGFADTWNFTRASYYEILPTLYGYEYELGARLWYSSTDDSSITLGAKVIIWGIFWFGEVDTCKFVSPTGESRGEELEIDAITEDATDGAVRYSLQFTTNGNTAGSLVCYWNTTQYTDAQDAWDNEELYLLHGVGIDATATANIGALLVSLLFLQLPGVPVLVNMFIAVPVWAAIVYILWFVIKEMIPFA